MSDRNRITLSICQASHPELFAFLEGISEWKRSAFIQNVIDNQLVERERGKTMSIKVKTRDLPGSHAERSGEIMTAVIQHFDKVASTPQESIASTILPTRKESTGTTKTPIPSTPSARNSVKIVKEPSPAFK
jgi:hypothetical protein